MPESIPWDAIVVSAESLHHGDPGEIVASNARFVDALFREYLTVEEIAPDALRSYYVDNYGIEIDNGGFSQFVYNSYWDPLTVRLVREGMQAMGATRHLEVFERGVALIERLGPAWLEAYLTNSYFDENEERDELAELDDEIAAAREVEHLVMLNATWLRNHPQLYLLPTEDDLLREARRRGEALPDRERRIAEALAKEPRYMKLIRALCQQAGHALKYVTGGDPTHVHAGERILAWHFITDKGHHYMVEADGKAIMFRGASAERVCEIDVSAV